MKQSITKSQGFEFFPKTDTAVEEFVTDMIQHAEVFEWYDEFGNPDKYESGVPSVTQIVHAAFSYYEDHLFQYAVNGHFPVLFREIEESMKDGLTSEDIMEMWREFREYNSSYHTSTDLEMAYQRDIVRALDTYHLSYFNDNLKGFIYGYMSDLEYEEWKNAPILEVW